MIADHFQKLVDTLPPDADRLAWSAYFASLSSGEDDADPERNLICVVPKATVFAPQDWTLCFANCFAYALDEPALAEAIPGSLSCVVQSELSPASYSPETIRQRLLMDGLVEIDDPELYPNDHVIACAIGIKANEGRPDFHFWRRDKTHYWSHKRGTESHPSDTDDAGGPIFDPQYIDPGPYDQFVGYFIVPPEGIVAQKRVSGFQERGPAMSFSR